MGKEYKELENGLTVFSPDNDNEISIEVDDNSTFCYLTKQDLLEMLKMFEGEE